MYFPATSRFISSIYQSKPFGEYSKPFSTDLTVVNNGTVMDPFYRNAGERAHEGRAQHLGVDITGSETGNRSITDPRRGLPVYTAIETRLQIDDLNNVKAYNKVKQTEQTGVGLPGSGTAVMSEAKIAVQPWSSTEDHSYGGIIAFSCIYDYNGTQQFTLYIEFLHLISERFLPKDASGRIASLQEWNDTNRGIGFGPAMQNNETVQPAFFQGPVYNLIGYLGATQTPHVHVQAAFFPRRTFDKIAVVRIDPMLVIY